MFHLDKFNLRKDVTGEVKGMQSMCDSWEALQKPGVSDIPPICLHPSLSFGSHPSLSRAKPG